MLCDAFKTNVTNISLLLLLSLSLPLLSSKLYNTENGQPQSDMATVIKSNVKAKVEEKRSGMSGKSHARATHKENELIILI